MSIERQVLDRIPRYREKAIHLLALSSELAISESKVKYIIKGLRLKGVPILSDKRGYWIAENEEEQRKFADVMKKQAYSRLHVAKEIQKIKSKGEFKEHE